MASVGSESFFNKVQAINPDHMAPLYVQLRDAIRVAIDTGKLQAREALPAEREISSQMQISRITVRKAISDLVEEGLLIRQQGSGTFVSSRVEKQFTVISSFSEDMAARGRKVQNRWLVRELRHITTDEALAFGQSPDSMIFSLARIRFADELPMAIENSSIAKFALTNELEDISSLYKSMQDTGNRPVRALQRMRAVLLDDQQAKLLDVANGSPALFIERRGFNAEGHMVELTKSWYRADSYDFVSEISGS